MLLHLNHLLLKYNNKKTIQFYTQQDRSPREYSTLSDHISLKVHRVDIARMEVIYSHQSGRGEKAKNTALKSETAIITLINILLTVLTL